MWPRVRDQRLFFASISGLIALAWLSLWLWSRSPYAHFLSHEENDGVVLGGLGHSYLLIVLLFAAGWTLMTIAMMLPTSLPLVALFASIVRQRPNRAWLVGLVVAGYLGVWTLFALIAHAGDLGIHEMVTRVGWLESNEWTIAAGTFLFAGAYQFSSLKYRCLEKCRSPMSFVMGRWRGRNERVEAFALGVQHGLFCLGCCWSLMLLMFALGVANLGWMLALGAVMAIEKNAAWGRRLSVPLGLLLLGWGGALVGLGLTGSGSQ